MAVTLCRDLTPDLCAGIRRFADAHPHGRLEHDPRWLGVLRQAMGHDPVALVARDADGTITGYLPLAGVSSALFGRYLVSLPYVNRAGILAADDATAAALLDAAIDLARDRQVQYLELRHDGHELDAPALTHTKHEKVVMVLDLPESRDDLMGAVPSKVRNLVRKGQKHGLELAVGGAELVDEFYSIFAVNMRDLGTPVYPRRLFAGIVEAFPESAQIVLTRYEGATIAGALLLHDTARQVTQVPSASCLRQFNPMAANMWMYFELLGLAVDRGARQFDFGRTTPESGPHRFKKQWGAKPRETPWQYVCLRGEIDAMRPDHPRMQKRIAAWQKLPVWVTRLVGPQIVRGIP